MKTNLKSVKGITLIALVITIVVLLILAGVSIATLTGENGIITNAQKAKTENDKAGIKEQIQVDLLAAQSQKTGSIDLTEDEINGVLTDKSYTGKLVATEDGGYITETTEEGNKVKGIEITVNGETTFVPLSEVYGGSIIAKVETIPTETSYVGYYADMEGDGTVDGIIYADLAIGEKGKWNNDSDSSYEYSPVTGLKEYYVSKKSYEDGKFGTKDVISPVSGTTGNDRFYIMALEDFKTSDTTFYWYKNAYGKLDRAVASSVNDFGKGKENTIKMIDDWNNKTETYGAQDAKDLWGVIQSPTENKTYGKNSTYPIVANNTDSGKWFVPSRAEWSAFGDYLYKKLSVTTNNYGDYGLSNYYWSSSQRSTLYAYRANFTRGYIGSYDVNSYYYVRLSATF